jgi:hypothetical protein
VNTGHGGAAAPSHHNLVGLTCRSAQTLANQRSTVRSSGTHRTCERALPPHLRLRLWASARQAGPLPWGEGVHHRLPSFQARPINIRKHPQAFPSPRGEGQGEGKRSLRILQPPRNCPTPCGGRLFRPPQVRRSSRKIRSRRQCVRLTVGLEAPTHVGWTAPSDGSCLFRSAQLLITVHSSQSCPPA